MTATAPRRRPGELAKLTLSQARHLHLHERIRWARERKDISQDRLAEMIGTSRRHMIRLEKPLTDGGHRPGAEFRARIALATEQPPELFSDDEEEESDPVAVDLVKTLMRRLNEQVEHSIEERVDAALRERGL